MLVKSLKIYLLLQIPYSLRMTIHQVRKKVQFLYDKAPRGRKSELTSVFPLQFLAVPEGELYPVLVILSKTEDTQ